MSKVISFYRCLKRRQPFSLIWQFLRRVIATNLYISQKNNARPCALHSYKTCCPAHVDDASRWSPKTKRPARKDTKDKHNEYSEWQRARSNSHLVQIQAVWEVRQPHLNELFPRKSAPATESRSEVLTSRVPLIPVVCSATRRNWIKVEYGLVPRSTPGNVHENHEAGQQLEGKGSITGQSIKFNAD